MNSLITFLHSRLIVVLIILTFGLVACHSGEDENTQLPADNGKSDDSQDNTGTTSEDGSGSGNTTSGTASDITLTGTASIGIIQNGIITAYELDALGEIIADAIGNAVTDVNGDFNLVLSNLYTGGLIEVRLAVGVNTQIKCVVPKGCGTRPDQTPINFADWYTPPAFTLIALLPGAISGQTITVNITPFSHMAAARARSFPVLNAAAIEDANSETSNLLGAINILEMALLDISDDDEVRTADSDLEVTFSALVAALANPKNLGVNGQPNLDLNAAIALLAGSFTAGTIFADDTDGDDGAQISLQEIVHSTLELFEKIPFTDLSGVLIVLQTQINEAFITGGIIDPDPD